MRKFNPDRELKKIQKGNKNKIIFGVIALLLIISLGSSYALYQIRYSKRIIYTKVADFSKDLNLAVFLNGIKQSEFPTKKDGIKYNRIECDNKNVTAGWDYDDWKLMIESKLPNKCNVYFITSTDTSRANPPELYQGLVPITFEDDGTIKVADTTKEWYNYDAHKWANAVLVTDSAYKRIVKEDGSFKTNESLSLGTDILQMYVWIPRYKYELFNTDPNGVSNEQMVNIKFETNKETTGRTKCAIASDGKEDCIYDDNKEWYTHPAFTFGNTQLSGIWFGKFTSSHTTKSQGIASADEDAVLTCIDENCQEADNIRMLPLKSTLRYNNLSNYFYASLSISRSGNFYNLNTDEVDTHLVKSIEWGAVAYLTQSKYGIFDAQNHSCMNGLNYENCEVYINNNTNYFTGCAGDTVSSSGTTNCNEWSTKAGQKASSTGNLYGIYDLSGGSPEYNMGNMVDANGAFNPVLSGFKSTPESKYYDKYNYGTVYLDSTRGHLGDSTREIKKKLNDLTGGWYNDIVKFPDTADSWIIRCGNPINTANAGVLYFYALNGEAQIQYVSFRVVLTAQDGID